MYQAAALVFIAAAAGGALYLAQRPTIATSAGLAHLLRESASYSGSDLTIDCDDDVPLGVDGARFHCTVGDDRGSRDHVACTLHATGSFSCAVSDSERVHGAPKSGDAWE